MTSLPDSLGGLVALEKLWLYDNQLPVLPDALGDLVSLTWLTSAATG